VLTHALPVLCVHQTLQVHGAHTDAASSWCSRRHWRFFLISHTLPPHAAHSDIASSRCSFRHRQFLVLMETLPPFGLSQVLPVVGCLSLRYCQFSVRTQHTASFSVLLTDIASSWRRLSGGCRVRVAPAMLCYTCRILGWRACPHLQLRVRCELHCKARTWFTDSTLCLQPAKVSTCVMRFMFSCESGM
jgi:hypothetical protein